MTREALVERIKTQVKVKQNIASITLSEKDIAAIKEWAPDNWDGSMIFGYKVIADPSMSKSIINIEL